MFKVRDIMSTDVVTVAQEIVQPCFCKSGFGMESGYVVFKGR